jgi:hypothetical protein
MHMAFFSDFFEHGRRRIVEYGFNMLLSFNNVIIIIMNTYFPEPPSVLASLFFHFEPDKDFAIWCIKLPSYSRHTSHLKYIGTRHSLSAISFSILFFINFTFLLKKILVYSR